MEVQKIITRQLASGDCLTIPWYHFRGSRVGAPSLHVQAVIHGAETQGYWVALQLLDYFYHHPPYGDVTIVPLANPYGANNKMVEHTAGRFDPVSGDNWNRHYADLSDDMDYHQWLQQQNSTNDLIDLVAPFKQWMVDQLTKRLHQSHAYSRRLNLQLQRLACQADIVFDLHCDTFSCPHLYAPAYAEATAVELGIPYVITLPHLFAGALDEAIFCPWWQLLQAFNEITEQALPYPPVESFTIELGCQEQIHRERATEQCRAMLTYLAKRGVCSSFGEEVSATKVVTVPLEALVNFYSPCGGLVVEGPPLGQRVTANQPLMTLSQPHRLSETGCLDYGYEAAAVVLVYPHDVIPITHIDSSNVHEGMAVMKLLRLFS